MLKKKGTYKIDKEYVNLIGPFFSGLLYYKYLSTTGIILSA